MSKIYAVVGFWILLFGIWIAGVAVFSAWEEKKRIIARRQTRKEEREKEERERLEMAVKSIEQVMAGDQ
jgi:hypothetical protein